jgi:hypothetical protein
MSGYIWFEMRFQSALISSIIMAIAIFCWVHSCTRILNRFQVYITFHVWAYLSLFPCYSLKYTEVDPNWSEENNNDEDFTELLKYLSTRKIDGIMSKTHVDDKLESSSANNNFVHHEGYLGLKDSSANKIEWKRKYFVLVNTLLFYYENKRDFESSPKSSACRKPIKLHGYSLAYNKDISNGGYVIRLVVKSYNLNAHISTTSA